MSLRLQELHSWQSFWIQGTLPNQVTHKAAGRFASVFCQHWRCEAIRICSLVVPDVKLSPNHKSKGFRGQLVSLFCWMTEQGKKNLSHDAPRYFSCKQIVIGDKWTLIKTEHLPMWNRRIQTQISTKCNNPNQRLIWNNSPYKNKKWGGHEHL